MRKLKINRELALYLATLRKEREIDEVYDLRLEDIEAVEEEFGFRIPDAILAYYASGLAGRFSGPMTNPRAMLELTKQVRAEIAELADRGHRPSWNYGLAVAFDYDNGNFLAVHKNTERTSDAILFLDHEGGGFVEAPIKMTLGDYLDPRGEYLDPTGEVIVDADLEPFTADIYSAPDEEQPPTIVEHTKFGRGQVIDRDETGTRSKWTVEFEDGTTKKLLADFLEVLS